MALVARTGAAFRPRPGTGSDRGLRQSPVYLPERGRCRVRHQCQPRSHLRRRANQVRTQARSTCHSLQCTCRLWPRSRPSCETRHCRHESVQTWLVRVWPTSPIDRGRPSFEPAQQGRRSVQEPAGVSQRHAQTCGRGWAGSATLERCWEAWRRAEYRSWVGQPSFLEGRGVSAPLGTIAQPAG